ncbi:hypothetical protein ACOMHN_063642 [Nucella lapillus]
MAALHLVAIFLMAASVMGTVYRPPSKAHRDCMTPSGKRVSKGTWIVENGKNCTCPSCLTHYRIPKAKCVPVGCQKADGRILNDTSPGDIFKPSPCVSCICDRHWMVRCRTKRCASARCVDAKKPRGTCCPSCPRDDVNDGLSNQDI